jgi:lysophospholipase L1-like esterase
VKADDEYRILVLGDSITFCDYVSFDEAVTRQLEDRLGGRVPRVVVINAGLPGASASDELYHYLEIRDAVDPDLVLVGMYLNDSQSSGIFYARSLPEPFASSRFLSWMVNRVEALRLRLWTDESLPEIDPEWAERFRDGRDLHTGDMWHSQDAFDFEIYNARDDFGLAWNPQSWVIVERITRTTVLAARERDQAVAAFLYPVHMQVKGSVEDFQPQKSFRRMCRSLDLPCLDLVPALREDWGRTGTELYFDHCHLTPSGNGVVAAALAEWLDAEGLIPKPSPKKSSVISEQ